MRLLIGASLAIPELVVSRNLLEFSENTAVDEVRIVDGNPLLTMLVQKIWPQATTISTRSRVTARKAVSTSTHLLLLWDGDDLTSLIFESRIQKKPLKLVSIQVTKVVNKNKTEEFDIYIGRGSPWGNPFAIGQGEGPDRKEVIEKYRGFFSKKIVEDEGFRRGIEGMRGLRLACFCKPLECHGDIIAEYLDSQSDVEDLN